MPVEPSTQLRQPNAKPVDCLEIESMDSRQRCASQPRSIDAGWVRRQRVGKSGVHSCFRKIFATTDQSVVEQCMMFFECHHVQDTMGERKRKFLHKFRMLQNQLCMAFNDRATADLELR